MGEYARDLHGGVRRSLELGIYGIELRIEENTQHQGFAGLRLRVSWSKWSQESATWGQETSAT